MSYCFSEVLGILSCPFLCYQIKHIPYQNIVYSVVVEFSRLWIVVHVREEMIARVFVEGHSE